MTLPYNEDLTVNYDALRTAIFNTVVASSTPELSASDVTIEYYATADSGSLGSMGKAWMPLEGGKDGLLTYPAISAGEQKIRIMWGGNQNYAPTTKEFTVTVTEREQVQFNLNEAPYEVGLVFDNVQGYDYNATANAIYNAVVASTTPADSSANVTVEYNADPTGITDTFKPLDYTDLGGQIWHRRLGNPDFCCGHPGIPRKFRCSEGHHYR